MSWRSAGPHKDETDIWRGGVAVKTYELLGQLRELSVAHLRQLWSLSTERRQLRDDYEARRLTQAAWGETKRRLDRPAATPSGS